MQMRSLKKLLFLLSNLTNKIVKKAWPDISPPQGKFHRASTNIYQHQQQKGAVKEADQ